MHLKGQQNSSIILLAIYLVQFQFYLVELYSKKKKLEGLHKNSFGKKKKKTGCQAEQIPFH